MFVITATEAIGHLGGSALRALVGGIVAVFAVAVVCVLCLLALPLSEGRRAYALECSVHLLRLPMSIFKQSAKTNLRSGSPNPTPPN